MSNNETPDLVPHKKVIVKVQLPMATNAALPSALVYAEGREYIRPIAITPELKKRIGDGYKAYFYAIVRGDDLEIDFGKLAPSQPW